MAWRRRSVKPALVRESDAVGRTREIYRELKQALGIPHINLVYQLYGAYPVFLDLHWRAFKAAVASAEFFDAAEKIRAEAYTRVHNYFSVPALDEALRQLSAGARQELASVVETFHYTDALLLLILTIQLQAFEGPVGQAREHARAYVEPISLDKPVVVNESSAAPEERRIFDDMRRTLALGVLNTEYRAFARFPSFLGAYWATLKPVIVSPLHESITLALRETAWNLARELPVPVELSAEQMREAGLSDKEVSELFGLTESLVRSMAGMVTHVAVAKIGLEGGNRDQDFPNRAPQPGEEPTRAA